VTEPEDVAAENTAALPRPGSRTGSRPGGERGAGVAGAPRADGRPDRDSADRRAFADDLTDDHAGDTADPDEVDDRDADSGDLGTRDDDYRWTQAVEQRRGPATEAGVMPVDRETATGGGEETSRRRGAPRRRPLPSFLLFASGFTVSAAAAMRWSTLATGDEQRTFTGLTVGDGRITLVLGLTLAVLGLARLARWRLTPGDAPLGGVLAGLVVILAGADLLAGPPTLATFRGISADKIVVRPESGLYLSLAAGAVALLAALALARGGAADAEDRPSRGAGGAPHPEHPRGGGHRSGSTR
jgi:hypothetical protein